MTKTRKNAKFIFSLNEQIIFEPGIFGRFLCFFVLHFLVRQQHLLSDGMQVTNLDLQD